MTNLDNEQNRGKSGEQVSRTPLIECKYSPDDDDMFLFLTSKGLEELKSHRTLGTFHQETGVSFAMRHTHEFEKGKPELKAFPIPPNNKDFFIEISEEGCSLLASSLPFEERIIRGNCYLTGHKVWVILDEEMAEILAKNRAKAKDKKSISGYRHES